MHRHQVIKYAETAENEASCGNSRYRARARCAKRQIDIFIIDDDIARVTRTITDDPRQSAAAPFDRAARQSPGVNGQTDIFHYATAFIGLRQILLQLLPP